MVTVQERYSKVLRCGYCDLQKIMRFENPVYYNCGVYGWNCDIFVDFKNDIAITTGYRNMRGESIDSAIIDKYNQKADQIESQFDWTKYEEKKQAFYELVEEFYKELAERY